MQHLLNSLSDRRGHAGFVHPRLPTLLQERRAFGPQIISGEKNHTPAEGGMLPA
jgi:hypothetical protein